VTNDTGSPDTGALVDRARNGDRVAIARLISLVEAGGSSARLVAAALARPSPGLRAVAVEAGTLADAAPRLVRLRRTVPLRG